ncbi:hypothetical protein VTI28DRAFT_5942 [Corynascus sepedonium]
MQVTSESKGYCPRACYRLLGQEVRFYISIYCRLPTCTKQRMMRATWPLFTESKTSSAHTSPNRGREGFSRSHGKQ